MANQSRQPKGTEAGGQFAASVNPESTVSLQEVPFPLVRARILGGVAPAYFVDEGVEGTLSGEELASASIGHRSNWKVRLHLADGRAADVNRNDIVIDEKGFIASLQANSGEPLDLTEPVKTNAEAVAWCEGELDKTNTEYEAMVAAGKSEDPDALDMRDYLDELRDQLVDHQRDLIAELRAGQDSFDLNGSIADTICYRVGRHDPEMISKVRDLLVSDWEPDYGNFDDAISGEADAVMKVKRDELVAIVGEYE